MPPAAARTRVLSGIQPTADSFHFGNYLGAIRQWVDLQHGHDAFYCVVDLHALTVDTDPAELRRRTRLAAAQLLAAGLDPDACALFVQSHVPEHAELAWVLGCLTGFGEAGRMTQFKDKTAKGGRASVGLFTYPVLMAADILLYRASAVPVGDDQRQHLELTRTLAQRFNARFGDTFPVPEPLILAVTARIADLAEPTAKMSKSTSSPAGLLSLLDEADVLQRKVRRAVTDPGSEVTFDEAAKPGVSNLLRIHSALSGRTVEQLVADYAGRGYGALKADVAELVVQFARPIRERTQEWLADEAALDRVLAAGAVAAGSVARGTMADVRAAVGLLPRAD